MFNPEIVLSTGLFSRYPDFTSFVNVMNFMRSYKGPESFELLVYPGWLSELDSYATTIRQSEIQIAGLHAQKEVGQLLASFDPGKVVEGKEHLDKNIRFAEAIRARYVVLHAWGHPNYEKNFTQTIRMIKDVWEKRLRSVVLSIETVPSKETPELDLINQVLNAIPSACITLDTELFSWKNDINTIFPRSRLLTRINNIHVRDYDGKPFDSNGKRKYLEIGEGKIDFKSFFRQLFSRGYTGYITIENSALDEKGNINAELIKKSTETVKSLLSGI